MTKKIMKEKTIKNFIFELDMKIDEDDVGFTLQFGLDWRLKYFYFRFQFLIFTIGLDIDRVYSLEENTTYTEWKPSQ